MKIPTEKQANKNTRKAIERTEKAIGKLRKERSKASGRELRDIDEQIDDYSRAIRHLRASMTDA